MNSTIMDEGKRTSSTALRVQAALHELGIHLITVKEMPASTRTAKEAALAVGCTVAEIAKSLVFITKKTDRAILVIASGANRVNEAKFATTLEEEIERATPEFVRDKTGFSIGGVPPVGHSYRLETWMDASLFRFKRIWVAAGTPNAEFEVTPDDLKRITNAAVVQLG